ncbi:hypothetical protein BJV82DRAFT_601128 [Fennellomyces sp. T-0311]|nr:hypothetical protein BJV82DRAFT_601128 [Fennellomyces sp. T-0311]
MAAGLKHKADTPRSFPTNPLMSDQHFSKTDFTHAANCKAISLITREAGFESIQRSALEKLTEVLELYLENLLSASHNYAELSSRTKPNYHDILHSMEESGITLSSLHTYVNHTRNLGAIPTARETPVRRASSQFLASDDEHDNDDDDEDHKEPTLPDYVPSHLPKFPSRHSFRQTPVYIHRPDDPQRVRELNSQQSRIVEENLKRLMSAENQLLRRTERVKDDLLDITIPIVNYEGALQRRKRVKRARTMKDDPPKSISNEPQLS